MKPYELITNQIASLADWRGQLIARVRKLILDAAPGITEEWKWGTPTWTQNGLVVSVGPFKDHVGINFHKGAQLADPKGLFNGGLTTKTSRSINLKKDDSLNASAFQDLVRAAVAHNAAG